MATLPFLDEWFKLELPQPLPDQAAPNLRRGEGFRCLAFDAVGTLIYPEPSVAAIYHEVAVRHGSRLTKAEVESRFKLAFRSTERNDILDSSAESGLETSEEREYQRWRQIVFRVLDDVEEPDSAFAELYAHFANPASWRCFDDVREVLAQLAARRYRLAIASNFDSRLEPVCQGLAELRPIEQLVISANVGFRKPQPYDALFAQTGCGPAEVLMIGDDWENDFVGATTAGASAIHLKRRGTASDGVISSLAELLELLR